VRAILLGSRELAPGTRHFDFEVEGPSVLKFLPGQFISLRHRFDGNEVTRAYSLASPPDGNRFALCLNLVPHGHFSSYLFGLEPGAAIEMAEPLGFFTLRDPRRDAVFIATGTGIAPFRSMLLHHLAGETQKITLLFGCRYPQSLLYRDELEELTRSHAKFTLIETVTRPDAEWQGRTGRVQGHLDDALGGRGDVDVYICGLKEMVDDTRALLKQRGFDRKRIIYEKYD
jgi:ferredoxin-NADP reductase